MERNPNRAPSWSWGRWDGAVTYVFGVYNLVVDEYKATLLDCELKSKV